ncbi:ATP-binding protein [Bdellovibrio sp. NC01]|uniref:PAS domain-containing hybrid sensor histidine kinase/response regulator n=1 Tax=Bdellovibrio sp. NC01 TaxID=2220073 RepID=UPI00143DCDD9|nr:ATP-binding protein [Bdellovibrio sp. NC01]
MEKKLKTQGDALRVSEDRNRSFIELANDAFIGMDQSGNISDWNRQAEKIFGWRRDEVIGKQLADTVIPEKYRESHRKGLAKYLATGEGPILNHRIEITGMHKSGREIPIELTVYPIQHQDMKMFGSFIHDVTEERRLERIQMTRLKVAEILSRVETLHDAVPELLRHICEAMDWGAGNFWLKDSYDSELHCIETWAANDPQMIRFQNRSKQTRFKRGQGLPGQVWQSGQFTWIKDLDLDGNFTRKKEAQEAGFKSGLAFPLKTSDDSVLGVMEFFSTGNDPDGLQIIDLVKDLGNYIGLFLHRKLAEEKLNRIYQELEGKVKERTKDLAEAYEQAQSANRLKDEFLATVSHELRTPLGVILGHSDMLLDGSLSRDEQIVSLQTIHRNARAQLQIISDLLDVSRIITGKMQLVLGPVDLASGIQLAIDSIRIAASTKNIEIIADIEPDMGPVRGDTNRLQQVLWNLLANAVKFTPKNGKVTVALKRINSRAKIEVTDSGRGIDPAFLPYIFERFRQEDASTTRRFGGLGLGLAIVRHLVEAHGGTIDASSPGVDRGSTFTVTLPLMAFWKEKDPHYVRYQPTRNDNNTEGARLDGVKILVVDDEADTLTMLGLIMRRSGATPFLASSMQEALQKFKDVEPEIVISDISMPEHDGYELIQRLREMPGGRDVPCVALTAHAREDEKRKVLEAGFNRHISKPVEPAQLTEAVFELVSTSPQPWKKPLGPTQLSDSL